MYTNNIVNDIDSKLVEQVLLGESNAFGVLVQRWEKKIYSLAIRVLGHDEDARDICQETFLLAFRNLKSFRGDAKFSSWLYRIAINRCNSHLKKQTGRNNISIDSQEEDHTFELTDLKTNVFDQIHHNEKTHIVRRTLETLPFEMKQVIIMKEYEELKFSEIAEILDVPVSTVKTRLYSGLAYLRKRLEQTRSAL